MVLQAIANGVVEGSVIALIALGLTVVFAVSRLLNVAHGDYLTFGAYATFWASQGLKLTVPLAALVGVVATIVLGLFFHQLVFKKLIRSSIAALVASIGIALLVRHAIIFIAGTGQQTYDLPLYRAWRIGDLRIIPTDLAVVAISLSAITLVHLLLRYTGLGREMRAVADNPELARVSGIRASRVYVTMWVVALALAALAGMLLGARTVIQPYLGWDVLIPAFAAAILGGLGNPYGAILGALVIGISQDLAVLWVSETYKSAIAFVILALMLLYKPTGLLGRKEAVR